MLRLGLGGARVGVHGVLWGLALGSGSSGLPISGFGLVAIAHLVQVSAFTLVALACLVQVSASVCSLS